MDGDIWAHPPTYLPAGTKQPAPFHAWHPCIHGLPHHLPPGTLCLGGKDRRQYCFCVTDLLGPDLHRAFLDTCGAHITAQQFVLLGKGMLRALQRAHTCGLVHR